MCIRDRLRDDEDNGDASHREERFTDAAARTVEAMKRGADVIVQATFNHERWLGRADILLRVDVPSDLGDWSYEVVDTKLARETRGGTILQLCLYSELLAEIQGRMPERMHVVSPGTDFEPESFRLDDFLAYYRLVKGRLESFVDARRGETDFITYPCLLYTSPSPRDQRGSRMPSSA